MKKYRFVVGIRCQSIGSAEIRIKDILGNYFSEEDIYFLRDATLEEDFSINYNERSCISFLPKDIGLLGSNDWGWRCGDFFYYIFRSKVVSDFYYLIEPDVYFSAGAAVRLFNSLSNANHDLIAHNLNVANEKWYWYESINKFYKIPCMCDFPFTRMSGRAIDYAYKERSRVDQIILSQGATYPNDESVIASCIYSSGSLSYCSMEKLISMNFKKYSTMHCRFIEFCKDEDSIYHSVLDEKNFLKKFVKILKKYNFSETKKIEMLNFAFDGVSESDSFFLRSQIDNEIKLIGR